MKELSKQYNPKETEGRIYKFWEDKGLFSAEVSQEKKPYSIVIPPPNITGILHMGHALNNTIQDILIRYKKMQGYETLWMPGTDHAGIATQNVVERKLSKEGKKRHDLGREKFIDEVWKWQKEYGGTIIKQLRRLGSSCDWRRERFTMDEGLSKAVVEVFIQLYKKGLIYRGNYIINWCPRCQTALSDEEAEHRELDGHLYYIKYPIKGSKEHITVATTRPETMLGDTAVAVNPKDKRYKSLIGGAVILPVINKELKVIADDLVDPKFGTGIVKVTPAHDPNDFLMGKKHNLEEVNIMRPDGVLNEMAGEFEGMDRFEAREALLEVLKEKKLLEKVEPHKHAVGHCYRCHTVVEPYLSKQWFVKMKPLAEPAIKAVEKGKLKFYPDRWTKVYLEWMNNIRDWCISRQIWWGHRIPVYYCQKCQEQGEDKGVIVAVDKPGECPDCSSTNMVQDPDVLDTWFSSWLWPFSTLGWPFNKATDRSKEEFEYFYPTSCLVTAQEIIFFWVARMIMAGLEFCGDVPFEDVYIHGTVRDDTGTKMSKSLGNVIDPIEIIDEFGADALRFSIISITAVGQDVFLSRQRFEMGRNFANKIWNVSRFLLINLKGDVNKSLCGFFAKGTLSLHDRWILSSLYRTIGAVEKAITSYKFNEAANLLYEFIWHKYCDWYVEIAKSSIDKMGTQLILFKVLEKSLRMLHPFMPFITEEIWQKIGMEEPIMQSGLPHIQKQMIDEKSEKSMERIIEIIVAIRNIRAEMNIPHKLELDAIISTKEKDVKKYESELKVYTKRLSNIKELTIEKLKKRPKLSASSVLDFCEIFIPLEGVIDINVEMERLQKRLKEHESLLFSVAKKLSNKDFIQRAPKDIVEKEKGREEMLKDKLTRIKANIKSLA
ncbi:MAG: valine--tRNA ligase [Candidatus Omnitrophica bacterium]|nr:valine--tRNA ligase [Candidatus Omnitrophota bacterium]